MTTLSIDLLDRVALMARAIESRCLVRDGERPIEFFLFCALVYARRHVQALRALYPAHAREGILLERALVELWIDVQWILLPDGDKNERAKRFAMFVAVSKTRMLERLPSEWRGPDYDQLLAFWTSAREAVRHLFRVKDRKTGKPRLSKTWALDGERQLENIESRAGDVMKQSPSFVLVQNKAFLYNVYSSLSEHSHVTQVALDGLVDFKDGSLMALDPPRMPGESSLLRCAAVLIDLAKCAVDEFGLGAEYEEPVNALITEIGTELINVSGGTE